MNTDLKCLGCIFAAIWTPPDMAFFLFMNSSAWYNWCKVFGPAVLLWGFIQFPNSAKIGKEDNIVHEKSD